MFEPKSGSSLNSARNLHRQELLLRRSVALGKLKVAKSTLGSSATVASAEIAIPSQ